MLITGVWWFNGGHLQHVVKKKGMMDDLLPLMLQKEWFINDTAVWYNDLH